MSSLERNVVECLFLAVVATFWSAVAYGSDGIVQINQAQALAGNVTPGDAPGFPVSITVSGSYRLVGDLIVSDPDTSAIVVSGSPDVDNFALDLNGFQIVGPNQIGQAITGQGKGVDADVLTGATVTGGTIRGFGGGGIWIESDLAANVDRVVAVSNGTGIAVTAGTGCAVSRSQSQYNAMEGFVAGSNCSVRENLSSNNGATGIYVEGGTVVGNIVQDNGGAGIEVAGGLGSVIRDNQIAFSGGAGISCSAPASVVAGNTVRSSGGAGILFEASSIIRDNAVVECGGSFCVSSSSGASSVSGNAIGGSFASGLRSPDGVVVENVVAGTGSGIGIDSDGVVSSNRVKGVDYGLDSNGSVVSHNASDASVAPLIGSSQTLDTNACNGTVCP